MGERSKEAREIDKRATLAHLMERYKNLIFSLCLRMTGDYFAAEDLTQETFLSAWEHLSSFDGQAEKAWLCRIAANLCTDYLRKGERRAVPTAPEKLPEESAPESESPVRRADTAEVLEELGRAVAALPPPYRETAEEYYLRGRTAREISESTGTPLKTVQTRLRRAREMLKKTIRKELLTD